jgi:trimethylamine:corrinoid methyltransferase-like protein
VKPRLELLDRALLDRILEKAFALLMNPGVKVGTLEAAQLLTSAGAGVEDGVAHIPEPLARRALQSAPREFWLYDRASQLCTTAATMFILIPVPPA